MRSRVGTTWQFQLPNQDEIMFVVVETGGTKKVTHKALILIGGAIELKSGGPTQQFKEGETYEFAETDDWDASKVLKRIA